MIFLEYLNKKESVYKIKNFMMIICNTTDNNLHGILKKLRVIKVLQEIIKGNLKGKKCKRIQ